MSESENYSSQRPTGPLIFGPSYELNEGTTVDDLCEENDVSGSDTSESGGEKRKASRAIFLNRKRKATRKEGGTWSDSKVEELLKFVREYKSKCEFKSVNFEADLQSVYTEVLRCTANLPVSGRLWSAKSH